MTTAYLKVTVIITSFNHAPYLREAIDSVLSQTFPDFELIIWDDASKDDSWSIIQSYQDLRIKAFRNESQMRGIWGINKAISEVAQGEYIAIHHSDDVWEPHKLAKQVAYLDAHPDIGAVFTHVQPINEEGEPFIDESHNYFKTFDQPNRTRHEWLRYFFTRGNALCHPSVMVRKVCYDNCGLYRFGLAQLGDLDMWIRLCLKYEIYILPEKLTKFRVRNNEENTSGNRPEVQIRIHYEFYQLLFNFLKIPDTYTLLNIFPEAAKHLDGGGVNLKYALARVALELKPYQLTELFGLNILFDLIQKPETARELESSCQFNYKDFIELTGRHDALSINSLATRHGQVAILNQTVEERDRLIDSLNQTVAERDALIANLNQTAAERNALIDSLNQTVAERDRLIDSLNQTVAERDRLIDSLNQTVAERDGLIDRLTHEIKALRHSTSWKLTAPLRWPIHQLKRARHLTRIAPLALEVGGGLRPAITKTWRLYRREGLAGLKRGIVLVQSPSEIKPVLHSDGFDRNDYEEWVRRYDTLDDNSRQRIKDQIAAFPREPKISVLVPVYDPPLNFLDAAIWSVRKQLYPHWELCIADDASKNQAVRDLLHKHAEEDERIKVVCRTTNGHISAASNSALELATGEYVALLDHDDLLAEQALFWVAQTILDTPDAGLIYSDEDKIDESGKRYHPYFKCELNPELLLAQNMISHLGVYRRDLLKAIDGFRTGLEGSQDYDLALRVAERLSSKQIKHIPRILYHWRAIAGSTALDSNEKNYAAEAGRKAVKQHIERLNLQAEVVPAPEAPTLNRVRFFLPDPAPLVSIIIPTRDRVDLLSICVNSILTLSTYPAFEIIIVDNGSVQPETAKYFAALPTGRIQVVHADAPFNFSWLNNMGAQKAHGEVFCLLNNDVEILSPGWLEEMVSFACQSEIGCVGARLWYPDGHLQHGGILLGVGGVANHAHYRATQGFVGYFGRAVLHQNFSAVTAACLVIRRVIYEEVGGLDETFEVAFNDVDFCLRVREAGYRNVWTPYAEMIHHESVTRGAEDTPAKQARFREEVRKMQERWGKVLLNDPAYSPNLTLDHEDFSLAWPPRVDLQMKHTHRISRSMKATL